MTNRCCLPRSCRAGCWVGTGCGEPRVPSPPVQPSGPTTGMEQAQVGGPGSLTALQEQTTPWRGAQAGMSWHPAGEVHGQPRWWRTEPRLQLREWPWLPNPGGAVAGVAAGAQHAHTSDPNWRIGHLSAENCILQNNRSTSDLSLLERATKALGRWAWELKHITPVDAKSWAW